MTRPAGAPPPAAGSGAGPGWCFTYLLCLAACAFFLNLGGRTIENKEYVRYAEVGREILELNDWVLLSVGGEPYVDKPPLHFWNMALSYMAFGVSAGAARVPSAAAAFGGVVLVFALARRITGDARATMGASLALMGMLDWFHWGRRTRIDAEFAFFFSLAMACLYFGHAAVRRGPKALWYAGFWAATGLAFLDKGPVAFLTVAIACAWFGVSWRARRGQGRDAAGPRAAPLLFVLCAAAIVPVVGPWAWAVWTHPQFARYLELFRDKPQGRAEGIFFYLWQAPLRMLPVTPLVAAGVWAYVRDRRAARAAPGLAFAATWAAVYFLALHVTSAKSQRYLLPMYVPCAVLAGWGAAWWYARRPRRADRALMRVDRIAMAVAWAAIAVFPVVMAWLHDGAFLQAILYTLAIGGCYALFRWRRPSMAAGLCLSLLAVFHAVEAGAVMHNEISSDAGRIARAVRAEGVGADGFVIHAYGDRAQRLRTVLSFYFDRVLPLDGSLEALVRNPAACGILTSRDHAGALPPEAGRVVPLEGDLVLLLPLGRAPGA